MMQREENRAQTTLSAARQRLYICMRSECAIVHYSRLCVLCMRLRRLHNIDKSENDFFLFDCCFCLYLFLFFHFHFHMVDRLRCVLKQARQHEHARNVHLRCMLSGQGLAMYIF